MCWNRYFSAAHGEDRCGADVNTIACGGAQSREIFAHGSHSLWSGVHAGTGSALI